MAFPVPAAKTYTAIAARVGSSKKCQVLFQQWATIIVSSVCILKFEHGVSSGFVALDKTRSYGSIESPFHTWISPRILL